MGTQQAAGALAQGATDVKGLLAQLAQIQAQRPQLMNQALSALGQQQQTAYSDYQSNQAKQQQLALEQQAYGLKAQDQKFSQNVTLAKLKNQQDQFIQSYNLKVQTLNARAKSDAYKASLPDASLSKGLGYLVDSTGAPLLRAGKLVTLPGYTVRNGEVVKRASAGSSKAKLTPLQIQTFKGSAETIAAVGYRGGTDAKGQALPPLSYQDALEHMRMAGVPIAIAVKALNRFYKPGERGRPPMVISGKGGLGIKVLVNEGP